MKKIGLRFFSLKVGAWFLGISYLVAIFSSCNQPNNSKVEANKTAPAKVGINFYEGSWSDALAEAKKQNKYIFLDTYAEWCSPCKWMEKNIFTKDSVGKFYNEKFISYRMDMEKGEGIELYKKFGLTGYPSFLFFKPDGEIIHHTQGSEDTEDKFIQVGKDVFDENKALFALKAKYENPAHDSAATLKYLLGLKKAYLFMDKYHPVMDDYVRSQSQPLPITPENWTFLKELVTDINHPFYKDLVQREPDYTKSFGKDETKGVIYTTQMDFYSDKKDWKNYATSAIGYVESVEKVENPVMVSLAWTFIDNISDKKLLQKVQLKMQKVVESAPTYDHLQTNANLLAKIGDKNEAVKQAELAITKAKESGDDYKDMEELIKKNR